MADIRAATTAAIKKRARDTGLPRMPRRTPSQNNPYAPAYEKPRRGGPSYRERATAYDAIGNVDRERKEKKRDDLLRRPWRRAGSGSSPSTTSTPTTC